MADKLRGKLTSYFVINYIERWQELRTYKAKPFLKPKSTKLRLDVSLRNAWALAAVFDSSAVRKVEGKSLPDAPSAMSPPKTRSRLSLQEINSFPKS